MKPDIIQTWLLQMEVLGGVAAIISHMPWIFSERSSAGAYPLTIKKLARQRLALWSTAIISTSAAGDHYWQTRVGGGVRRHTVHNGIPLAEIEAGPVATLATLGLRSGAPLIPFAGRFEAEKNGEEF